MESLLILYLPSIISLAGLNLVALISPGPDFAVVVRNSLIYSRKTALLTALGIALGIFVHVSYSLLGLGFIIKENAWLFVGIKYLGAGYLLYIGISGLRSKKKVLAITNAQLTHDISAFAAIGSGFLTNALNPKCILFFISLFSVIISPSTPTTIMFIYGFLIFVETLAWFSFVAFCLSGKRTREKFNAVSHWIERVTGGVLIALGAKLFLTV
ncbi:MAG TPA: LysE family transporter [Alphaproteobacteria bacterium]|nr:LysE family transporter [Alphaproteobacteria bacterium]